MAQPSREDLLRKLRAIKELAERGGTEGEMANAAERFAAILARYNLTAAEVEEDGEGAFVDSTRVRGKYNETWRRRCYRAAAELYMCHYYFQSYPGRSDYTVVHNVVGEPHNTAVAVEIAAYFEASINRLANEASRTEPEAKRSHTHRHRFIRSFRLAAVIRLNQRVDAYVARAKAGKAADVESGTTLPALQSLYDRSEELYLEWLRAQGIDISARKALDKGLSQAGLDQGRRAGEGISLSSQLKAGGEASRYALK